MNINKAFELLGLSLDSFLESMNTKSLRQKRDTISSYLELAKSHRKHLLAVNHPDRGGSPEQFNLIQEAFAFIESQSVSALESLDYKLALNNKSKVKVEIN